MKRPFLTLLALAALTSVGMAQDLSKYTFEGMVGPGFPTGSAKDRLNLGYNFLFGGGLRFNSQWAGLLEFQYDHFSLNTNALQSFNQPDGFNRFWSLTINPRYYIRPTSKVGGYVTAGYGLYARTLAFTDPSQAVGYCDPYYGDCYSSGAPVIASFTNYKSGINAGGGVTYALGESGFKFVTDLRYNRFLSRANNEYITLSFGILF